MRYLLSIWQVVCLLALILTGGVEARDKWEITRLNGIDYVKLQDLWEFYKFTERPGRAGCVSYGAGNRTVSIKPSRQDFYVNDYRYILSYPVQTVGGQLYISATDISKLVDPVLRPRLSRTEQITTVVLDPGHGGHDAGAVSSYAREKDCNLELALKVRDKLKQAGFKVVMTRDKDFFLTLGQRVAIANRTPNSIFVSIHHNSSSRSAASGIETFTLAPHGTTSPFARTRRTEELVGNHQDSENIALATAIHSQAIKKTGVFDRGIQRARFSVLCTIRRPAVLFEGGFVTNPQEGSKIASTSYQNILAQCICEGIIRYTYTAKGAASTAASSAQRSGSSSMRIAPTRASGGRGTIR